jgi:hypothetical protein
MLLKIDWDAKELSVVDKLANNLEQADYEGVDSGDVDFVLLIDAGGKLPKGEFHTMAIVDEDDEGDTVYKFAGWTPV